MSDPSPAKARCSGCGTPKPDDAAGWLTVEDGRHYCPTCAHGVELLEGLGLDITRGDDHGEDLTPDQDRDDDWLWRDVEQHQARAVKRLDADTDDAPLADGYGLPLPPPGTDPTADLARSLARDLLAAGFTIHDCAGKAPGGGVCLTPASNQPGVIVTWTQHDAAEAVLGYRRYRDIQDQMNANVIDIVATLGYPIDPYGQAGAHIVTGPRPAHDGEDNDEGDDEAG